MAKVKNTARGARGLFNKAGAMVMIEPGETAEGDFDSAAVSDFKKMLANENPTPAANEEPADDEDEGEAGPLDGSVNDVKAHVATVDSVEDLEALGKQEQEGKNRSGALDAIQARIDELKQPPANS